MSKTMELKGINDVCKSDTMLVALKKSGYKLLEKRVSWPRKRGQGIVLVDCSRLPCQNALFVR
jgi:hypothetical protein